MFVLHTVPTKTMATQLVREHLGSYDWTLTADELRAYPSLQVAVLECQMAVSAERVRRDRKVKDKVQAKAAEKRAQPDGWDDWKRQMNLRQAKTAAEKARRKKWAKKRKSRK